MINLTTFTRLIQSFGGTARLQDKVTLRELEIVEKLEALPDLFIDTQAALMSQEDYRRWRKLLEERLEEEDRKRQGKKPGSFNLKG